MKVVGPRDVAVVTVPTYLAAVRSIHGIGPGEVARALRVSPSLVRRWMRGALVPSFRRLKTMTTLWGGDAELLALGAALQRYSRTTGVGLDEATRMIRTGRRTAPVRRAPVRANDRRQLALPMGS